MKKICNKKQLLETGKVFNDSDLRKIQPLSKPKKFERKYTRLLDDLLLCGEITKDEHLVLLKSHGLEYKEETNDFEI